MNSKSIIFLSLYIIFCLSITAGPSLAATASTPDAFSQCAASNGIHLPTTQAAQVSVIFACLRKAKLAAHNTCAAQAGVGSSTKLKPAQRVSMHTCMYKNGFGRYPHPISSTFNLNSNLSTPQVAQLLSTRTKALGGSK